MKKSTKIWGFVMFVILALVVVGGVMYAKRDVVPTFETAIVAKQTVTQTVDASGVIRKTDTTEVDDDGNVVEDLVIEKGDEVVVDVFVTESDILKIKKGQTATMTLAAFGSDVEFSGKVLDIADLPTPMEGVVAYAVEVSLDSATDGKGDVVGLMAGMSADVTIVTNAYKNVIAVPSRTIVKKNGDTFVRVPDASKEDGYAEREIVTGARGDDGWVVVTSGLVVGDEIIVDLD